MAFGLKRFIRDDRGTSFEGIALSISIIAVGFVASADLLDYLTKAHVKQERMVEAAPVSRASPDLDLAPTASLPKLVSRSVLDPCTGIVK